MFEFETQTIHTMEYGTFEAGTKEWYGRRIEVLESPNDTTHDIGEIKKQPLTDYEKQQLEAAIDSEGIEYYYLNIVFQDLVNSDVLPEGHYQVHVSW